MGRGKGLVREPQSPPAPGKNRPLVLRVQGVVLALVAQAPDEDLQVVGLAGLVAVSYTHLTLPTTERV